MRQSPRIRTRLPIFVTALLSFAPLRADTTVPITGIGTSVAGDFIINFAGNFRPVRPITIRSC